MKKVILFASVVAVAMIAGGVTAYTVGAANEKNYTQNYATAFGEQAGNHIKSYQAEKYPDLT